MKCTINDLNLSFDKESRLRKTIMRISKTDSNKATALAGFLVNVDFKKFLLENITNDDVLQGETINFNLFTNNDYIKINQNRLGSLLADFYKNTYLVLWMLQFWLAYFLQLKILPFGKLKRLC